ncbi:MAG TPA: gliding motility-associated C-terminal domain-containing protein [Chitinophagaceae bacterium]|nr:gliding motility-associated C-terminal domain-containing protein [Chitinophagaceae bacterium]
MSLKTTTLSVVLVFLCSAFFGIRTQGQTFGTVASAVLITDCNQSNFFNTSGNGADLIGPSGNIFANANLGVHTQNSGTLILKGAEVRTFKDPGIANVCSARMLYRFYLQSSVPGAFNSIDLPLLNDCDIPNSQFPSGGPCQAGNQKWNRVIPDGATLPYAPVDLTSFAPGNYILEVYYDITGSSATTTQCNETVVLNNSGNNYTAFFSIQAPVLASNNPTTCNGTEGSITISGLVPGATYSISYTDDGVPVGPVNIVANGSGQVILSGLNAGVYSNFELLINGCLTNLFTGIILSDPLFTPTFTKIASFCAGSTPPVLPAMSNNGISGVWNPAVIDNQSSGSYTFTPDAGQCGLSTKINVTVIQKVTPTFIFGTSLTICTDGAVPTLPTTSSNGITGTWSPSVVGNQNSATYTFTPTTGLCATTTTFTVTVNPNITPTFSFGTSLTICEGGTVPTLSTTSDNGITGTWNPSIVDNQISATYTFTPTAGLCATTTTFTVTVNPNITPTFSFGTSLTICEGGTVPSLPNASDNGITGTWNPAVVSDQASGTYTFTPTAGLCATTTTFTVTVNLNITPTFSFGTSLTICEGGTVPALPNSSDNGITGTWSPSVVGNQNSATYTFTPTTGLCATTTTFTVTANPNITPTFSFGTSLTICEGGTVPTLSTTSDNGITGTWNPAVVDNQISATYTFTPTAGLCATTTTFTVTVNPNLTPTFTFGTSLTICSGNTVPALLTTSTNGITGTWNPADINNQASGVYTFTPAAGECGTITTFTVTVTPTITPAFTFGTSLTICTGATVPPLPTTSSNGIDGAWNPAIVNNQASGTYTFTPIATPEQCIATTIFTVTVKPILTPTFSFGTSLTVCAGGTVPVLPAVSTNSITGTWSPATVSNQVSGTYKFTSAPGQCATATATFTVTVNPTGTVNTIPDTTVNDGATILTNNFSGTPANVNFSWTNSNPAIGLPASGTGNVPSFEAVNKGNDPITGTITVTPTINGCAGTARSYIVTIRPLNKDVFVPNVFSPNGDGKNDMLFVYGNYIDKLDMRIFNQWGEQVIMINSRTSGWDGTHRGKAQPVGVYVYTLQAVLSDGRTIKMKGSITLLR